MYIEERMAELQTRVGRLEQMVQDLITNKSKGKSVLRFYTVDVPVAWETYTDREVRVSIDSKTLVNYDEDFEPAVLENYGLDDWLNAILMLLCIDNLGLDRDAITHLARELETTKDVGRLQDIKNIIEEKYILEYDARLEVDASEFSIYY